jgi:hypothetical protein
VVFEPPDEVKGDVARVIFYMYTRYAGLALSDNPQAGNEMGRLDDLLAWHIQDPVSASELQRNDGACQMQWNRNPFVDYPCLVGQMFGGGVASCGSPSNTPTSSPVPLPVGEPTSSPVPPPVGGPSEQPNNIIISQYLEGSGNYKALQVRNLGAAATALDSFQIDIYFNGGTTSGATIVFPSGTILAAGATFTICNPALDGQSFCDTFNGNVKMNGNDAVALMASSGASVVYDVVGMIGVDPSGGGFTACTSATATKDHTLVRTEAVTVGNGGRWEGNNGCSDWSVQALNSWVFSFSGSESITSAARSLDLPRIANEESVGWDPAALAGTIVGALATVAVGAAFVISTRKAKQKRDVGFVTDMTSSPTRVSFSL